MIKRIKSINTLHLFLILPVIFALLFAYLPMFGLIIAFEDYNIFAGDNAFQAMFLSPWVGLENFKTLFSTPEFFNALKNTLVISTLKIIFVFPIPIILAILLSELRNVKFLRVAQTILYMPHFLSWVILGGMWLMILGGNGLVNNFLINIGLITEPIGFMITDALFRIVLIITDAWKEMGWNSIIYLAAITSIDVALYEAIRIDGGSKIKEIWHVTLPALSSTIAMLFILRMASIMDAGFDQIFNMYSPYVYDGADVLSTYIYRLGMGAGEYSLSTAMGLMMSVIGAVLLLSANAICRRKFGKSIW